MNPWIHYEFLKQIPNPKYYILGHNWSHTKSIYAAFWGEMCKYFSKWSRKIFVLQNKKHNAITTPSLTHLQIMYKSSFVRVCFGGFEVLKLCACGQADAGIGGAVSQALNPLTQGLICMSMACRLETFRCTQKASHSDTHWCTKSHPISLSPLQLPQSMHSPATAYWQRASGTIPRRNVGSILLFAPSPQSEQRLERKGRAPPLKKGGERGEALGRAEAGGDG